MPIYVTDGAGTPKQLAQVAIGSKNIAKVYWGSTLKFQNTQVFTLANQTNLNIATYLSGQGASLTAPIIINLPAGVIVGSNDNAIPAVQTGDLSSYTFEPTFNVIGEIQGAPNGGDAFTAASDITINNTGAIRAGGGNGGNGGLGGYGTELINNTSWRDGWTSDSAYRTPVGGDSGRLIIYWGDNVGAKSSGDIIYDGGSTSMINYSTGGYVYQKGSQAASESGNIWWNIRQGQNATGTKGTGGTGGLGQGYGVTKTNGAAGINGTYRAGDGGDGGDGGDWGVDGASGLSGGTGYYWTSTSNSVSAAGASGTSGQSAGVAIDSGTATVTLLGAGVVNGDII